MAGDDGTEAPLAQPHSTAGPAGAQAMGGERRGALLARVRGLGFGLDISVFDACPQELPRQLVRIAKTVESVAAEAGAEAARRDTYVLLNDPAGKEYDRLAVKQVSDKLYRATGISSLLTYPMCPAVAKLTGDEPLPVVLVPPAVALDAAASRPVEAEDQRPRAGTIWFEPLPQACRGLLGRAGAPRPSRGLRVPLPDARFAHHVAPALQGKVVAEGALLDWARAELLMCYEDAILGEVHVTEVEASLYDLRYRIAKKAELRTWGIPVADANGAGRWTRTDGEQITVQGMFNKWALDEEGRSRYENVYGGHLWSTIGRHSLLVVAKPLLAGSGARRLKELSTGDVREKLAAWAGVPREQRDAAQAQERLVVTRELLRLHPVLVLRKARTWRPFMEDADVDSRLVFHGADVRAARVVVVAADLSDADLLRFVRAYYGLPSEAGQDN